MESFKSFFNSSLDKRAKFNNKVTPHHRTDKRVADRGIGFRDGKEQGLNFKADKWKIGNHNYDQNANQDPNQSISNDKAQELADKHGIDLNKNTSNLGRLGKRPFKLVGTKNNYRIKKLQDNELRNNEGGF
jgi:hypothetical protein